MTSSLDVVTMFAKLPPSGLFIPHVLLCQVYGDPARRATATKGPPRGARGTRVSLLHDGIMDLLYICGQCTY